MGDEEPSGRRPDPLFPLPPVPPLMRPETPPDPATWRSMPFPPARKSWRRIAFETALGLSFVVHGAIQLVDPDPLLPPPAAGLLVLVGLLAGETSLLLGLRERARWEPPS